MWPRIGGIARLKEGTATDLEEYVMERVGGTTTVMGQGDATILILVIRTTGNENIAGQALLHILHVALEPLGILGHVLIARQVGIKTKVVRVHAKIVAVVNTRTKIRKLIAKLAILENQVALPKAVAPIAQLDCTKIRLDKVHAKGAVLARSKLLRVKQVAMTACRDSILLEAQAFVQLVKQASSKMWQSNLLVKIAILVNFRHKRDKLGARNASRGNIRIVVPTNVKIAKRGSILTRKAKQAATTVCQENIMPTLEH